MSFIKDTDEAHTMRFKANSAIECANIQDQTLGDLNTQIGPFIINYKLTQTQKLILNKLKDFYTNDKIVFVLKPLVEQESVISLRALDWLVTNFSKKHNIACHDKSGHIFNIHFGYKNALSYFRRRNFDPFRRRLRLKVVYDDGKEFETTIGQLNFTHWAYANGVLDYASSNIKNIEQDMNTVTTASRKKRMNNEIQKKRNELSRSPGNKCTIYDIDSTVTIK